MTDQEQIKNLERRVAELEEDRKRQSAAMASFLLLLRMRGVIPADEELSIWAKFAGEER